MPFAAAQAELAIEAFRWALALMAKIMMRTISEGPAQLLHFLEFKPMQFALSHIEPCFGHLVASRCQVPPWWWKPSMPTRSRSWKRPWRQGMDGLKLLKMAYKQSLIEDIWRVFFDGFCVSHLLGNVGMLQYLSTMVSCIFASLLSRFVREFREHKSCWTSQLVLNRFRPSTGPSPLDHDEYVA